MGSEEVDDEGPPPGWPSIAPPQSTPSSEMAQMVCGTCRRLLKYPKGSRHVQCSCCSTVNFVLEAHEVGIVKCDGCAVLLMYPYGAPSVKCSSCQGVTKVGVKKTVNVVRTRTVDPVPVHFIPTLDHNRRPPWSVQQGQPPPPLNPVH